MTNPLWENLLLPTPKKDYLWELFHENSKTSRYGQNPPDEEIFSRMQKTHEALPFDGYPVVELPSTLPPWDCSLESAIEKRHSSNTLCEAPLPFSHLARILHLAYGVTHHKETGSLVRRCRAIPSAGALYPLEIFLFCRTVENLSTGLYHFNPLENHLRFLTEKNLTSQFADALVQPELTQQSSVLILISAVFDRTTFKYGDRGYRFIYLEAGHLAQNINLVATGLGLACLNIGGFFDRQVDQILGLDGITHSTIYLAAIGNNGEPHTQ